MVKKLIGVALTVTTGAWLLGASFFVPVASAQTDTQAQIAALLAQIAALQAQLNSGSSSTTGYQFTRNLTVGMTGTDVKELQKFLNAKGYIVAATGVGSVGKESTYFGPNTKAALVKYQAANAISATGFFGPITRAKVNASGGVVVTPGTPGSSAVVISLDNPSAGTIVTNQSLADLAHFTFNGNYTVTGLTFKRLGISADTSLSNVFVFEGDTRLTDSASVSSGGLVNFSNPNGLFTVNGNKTVAVKADMAASSGETVGIQLVSYTLSGGSPVTVNLSGNLQTVASATLAGVSMASATGSGNADPGNDIVVWQGTATVTTRDVLMKRLALRQIGSINSADIRNFRLFVDGVQVASQANLDANGYVTFANVNKALLTGARTLKVLADVVGGSGRTVQMSLRGAYDITVTDTQYNVNPAVTGSFPFGPSAFTVNAGTITVVKSTTSPNTDIVLNGSDVVLGKWTVTAYGEAVKIETMKFGATFGGGANTTSSLRNARVMVNGAQYGSTATLAAAGTTFTTNYTVPAGTSVTVELRGDVYNNAGGLAFAANHTILPTFMAGTTNGIPQTSLTPVNVPSSNVNANTLTIASGSASLAKQTNYANQTTVVPQTAYPIAKYNLTAGTAEDLNVNTFTVTYATGTASWTYSDLTNVYVKYGTSQTSPKATASASDSFSVSLTVTKGQSIPVEIYATLSSSIANTATLTPSLAVTANTASSGQTANVNATAGQIITAATSGTYTLAAHADTPVSAIVADNQTVEVVAGKVTTLNDSLTITDVTATVASTSAVSAVELWYDGALVVSQPATDLTFNGLNIIVPANTNKKLSLKVVVGNVGVGAGDSGYPITGTLAVTTAKNSAGSTASVSGTASGNAMYVFQAIPVISKLALPSATLVSGTNTLAKFAVATDGGAIAWKKIIFTVATSTNVTTLTSIGVWDADSNTQIAGVATSTAGFVAFVATSEQSVSGGKNYILKATVNGSIATADYVNTSIARPTTTYALAGSYATQAALNSATGSFIWSDQSNGSHSESTADWYTDALVKNLPTDTWNLTK